MHYCPSMMDGKGDGPLDLIHKDREALRWSRQRPGVHKTLPRYSPLREHVSRIDFGRSTCATVQTMWFKALRLLPA